jgi:hypothetical protein
MSENKFCQPWDCDNFIDSVAIQTDNYRSITSLGDRLTSLSGQMNISDWIIPFMSGL